MVSVDVKHHVYLLPNSYSTRLKLCMAVKQMDYIKVLVNLIEYNVLFLLTLPLFEGG